MSHAYRPRSIPTRSPWGRLHVALLFGALFGTACGMGQRTVSDSTSGRSSAVGAQSTSVDLAIRNVNLVDVADGVLRDGQTVLVSNGRIVAVGDAPTLASRAARRSIYAAGQFLMPGLWDMHVHLRTNGAPAWVTTIWLLPVTLAHGVTGVRDMNGDCEQPAQGPTCITELKQYQRAIESGTLVGPHILALSSFPIDPPFDFVMTEETAAATMEAIASRGVDLVKIYNRLTVEGLRLIAEAAKRVNLPIAGHVPLRVTAAQASSAEFRSIEHARDFLFDCFPGSAEFRRTTRSVEPPTAVRRAMVEQHLPAMCAETFAVLVRNGTWYVPTHVTRRMDAYADDSAFRHDPRSRYVPALVWNSWNRDADGMVARDSSASGRAAMRAFYRKRLELTGTAFRAGVRVLLGTDAGDSYVFPGSAVHDELGELVSAGLSPAEALRAATIHAAEFMGLEREYGSVAEGKHADLLLLDANPLQRIGNTRRISAVVFNGTVHERAQLDSMLRAVEAAVQRPLGPGDDRDHELEH